MNHVLLIGVFSTTNVFHFSQVAFQKILQLSYIDKLLDVIQLEFRDKYKNELEKGVNCSIEFDDTFHRLLREIEHSTKIEAQAPKKMRTFGESKKSQKTVASMISSPNIKDEKITKNQGKEGEYTYILLDDFPCNTGGYFTSCVVFFRAPQERGKMRATSKMSARIT